MLRLVDLALRLLCAAGLAIDAYVHAHLASNYDGISATVSQGDLFIFEAIAASVAALVVVILPWRRTAFGLAAIVGGGGLAAVLIYRYVDVGRLGPFPNMYEPIWYFQKALSAYAEATALTAAAIGLLLTMTAADARLASPARSSRTEPVRLK